jgi:cell division transport system permease protein
MLQTTGRIFLASWKNLFRNAWIGLATVFVFCMALLSINILVGLQSMVDRTVTILKDKVDVTVNFTPKTPEAVVTQAKFYLTSLPQVAHVEVHSPEQVLETFKKRHTGNADILSGLNEVGVNPFGSQFVIRARDTEDYPFLLQAIRNPQYEPFIESQSYDDHKLTIDRIQRMSEQARLVGSLLVAVFALFGALVAFNTIRIAIYTQREEIAIMRLVGASSGFIRGPFMLEAVWLAAVSLAVSAAATLAMAHWLEPVLQRSLFDGIDPGLIHFAQQQGPTIILIQTAGLVILALLVSWMAVGRYIKR